MERKVIELPEICRVEGHSAVTVDIEGGIVKAVQLKVFEGTRFFERIVIGHRYDEMPHITSRVCAICSTGHVIAACKAIEKILEITVDPLTNLYRKLMHLGMIIESHATHICALALPDFLDAPNIVDFATKYPAEFKIWTDLRKYGAAIQTAIGGRPFHPVNLHVGYLSRWPEKPALQSLLNTADQHMQMAVDLCELLMSLPLPFADTAACNYLALEPEDSDYSFFGEKVVSSEGFESSVDKYREYLDEKVVAYSHAKSSTFKGKPFMVGSMARLHMFNKRLGAKANSIYKRSALQSGSRNTIWNNLAQGIEIVEAFDQLKGILPELINTKTDPFKKRLSIKTRTGKGVGAVECPRGTLYHYYELDQFGKIIAADMITPSAQNSARIEEDIRVVCESLLKSESSESESVILQKNLETLIRAYDPCNTCATHMVQVRYA